MAIDLAVQIPSLVGSILSFLATSSVLVIYMLRRKQWSSFRHNLVLNLTIAEFINSGNNTISGIATVIRGGSILGPACVANGLIGQVSVQAADFGILSIAVSTALIVTRRMPYSEFTKTKRMLICACCWIVPFTTGFTALGLKAYAPVSGNWCWIKSSRNDLRYGLTHGWRFAIILTTLALYAYVFVQLRAHFAEMSSVMVGGTSDHGTKGRSTTVQTTVHEDEVGLTGHADDAMVTEAHELDGIKKTSAVTVQVSTKADAASPVAQRPPPPPARNNRSSGKDVARLMVLKAYPLGYIILWIPGITNRIIEASGHKSRPFAIMQASTQYIGFVNSVTYVLQSLITEKLSR